MDNVESNEQTITVAFVIVTYNNGLNKTFKIPLADDSDVGTPYATYSKIVESLSTSFSMGRDGFVQLAEIDEHGETVLAYIALWNVNDIRIEVSEEVINE